MSFIILSFLLCSRAYLLDYHLFPSLRIGGKMQITRRNFYKDNTIYIINEIVALGVINLPQES